MTLGNLGTEWYVEIDFKTTNNLWTGYESARKEIINKKTGNTQFYVSEAVFKDAEQFSRRCDGLSFREEEVKIGRAHV